MFRPGQTFVPSASRENDVTRMLREWKSGTFGGYQSRATMPLGHIMAKNTSGADLAFGDCALYEKTGFSNTEELPRADWDPRKGYITLLALQNINSTASPSIGGMAIAIEPIADGEFGTVAIAGPAVCMITASDVGYIRPNGSTAIRDHWGFARILTYDADSEFAIVDLSDTRFQVFYNLTANMSAGSAAATLCPGGSSWSTTVHDPHLIATWQVSGDSGFAEWRGDKWCVTIPLC